MIESLSDGEVLALGDVARIADALRIQLMLIGANARRLTFDIPFGFRSPRTTQDWDFAARIESWELFARFYDKAVHAPAAQFRPGDSAQRIVHVQTAVLLDLVPFGDLSEPDGKIRWPQSRQAMSVLGFEEAFESCIQTTLPNGLVIGVVTTALLAALKILAFSDRGDAFSRDLQDLWFIMERYVRPASQENRVFEELVELFPDESYYDHFHSLLLGWDIGRQCRPATLAAIALPLMTLSSHANQKLAPLLPGTGDLEEREARQREIASEFQWLQKGIMLATTRTDLPVSS